MVGRLELLATFCICSPVFCCILFVLSCYFRWVCAPDKSNPSRFVLLSFLLCWVSLLCSIASFTLRYCERWSIGVFVSMIVSLQIQTIMLYLGDVAAQQRLVDILPLLVTELHPLSTTAKTC